MFLGNVAISPSIRHALCRMTPQPFQQMNKTTLLFGSESVNADQSEPSPYAESKCGTAANLMAKHLSLLTARASCFISCLFNTHQHWRKRNNWTWLTFLWVPNFTHQGRYWDPDPHAHVDNICSSMKRFLVPWRPRVICLGRLPPKNWNVSSSAKKTIRNRCQQHAVKAQPKQNPSRKQVKIEQKVSFRSTRLETKPSERSILRSLNVEMLLEKMDTNCSVRYVPSILKIW